MTTLIRNFVLGATAASLLSGCVSGNLSPSTEIAIPGSGGLTWQISCRSAAVERLDNGFKFSTHPNTCTKNGKITGTFLQRSEINTGPISRSTTADYVFKSTLQFFSDDPMPVKIFQIHDGTVPGCPPPLSVEITETEILLVTKYKYDLGNNRVACSGKESFHDRAKFGSFPKIDFPRDGTPHEFRAEVDFKGNQHFYIDIYLDEKLVIGGLYAPPIENKHWIPSKSFFFKHGVYSEKMFDYEFISTNVELKRVSK